MSRMTGLHCPQCECPSMICEWWDTPTSAGGIYYDNVRHECTNSACLFSDERLDVPTSVDDTICPLCGRIGAKSGERHPIDRAWLDCNEGRVLQIAQAIEESRSWGDLPILADALREAGCHDQDLLSLCQSAESTTGGQWLVELLLGHIPEWPVPSR